ncbi:hypothetical protein BU14_0085s0013 [Porphyra umbilicalis]|uniref:Integrase catalytic domain-containing protein n=1 Tax=Porphyra umbilicalis TaxID=2786 RepID=A0A1X6PE71_PORUM|nr:hypothetical protein BU14_0085s0013 [Porphyra umbilicalis]|eukprot:OSX79162.1 hypothetical protein BU14_0085s0013 [Porphyra umbilicalis]
MGADQASAYARLVGAQPPVAPTRVTLFRFGGVVYESRGTLSVHIPLSPTFYLPLHVDVVPLDVPVLLGHATPDRYGLYVNNVTKCLVSDGRGFALPLQRKGGHIYLVWGEDVHYSVAELDRIHRHLSHPHPDRLVAVLRQAGNPHATAETRAQLDALTKACQVFQRLVQAPSRFRVVLLPDDIVFNRLILIDIMYLDGKPVLHVIDKVTLFSAAAFLSGEIVEAVWWTYARIWAHAYAGHPERMRTDQGPQFVASGWQALAHAAGIHQRELGVESHNSLVAGERYHAVLRHIYRRVKADHPDLPLDVALTLAVSAMNKTIGPHGLVPTLLVFGLIPRVPVSPLRLPTQQDRMRAAETACKEMRAQVARTRVQAALRLRVPAAADADLPVGTSVLVYREPPTNRWIGPHPIVARRDEMAWVEVYARLRPFNVDKLRRYYPPEGASTPQRAEQGREAAVQGTEASGGVSGGAAQHGGASEAAAGGAPAPPTGVTPAAAAGNAAVDVPPPATAAAAAGAPGEEDLGALLNAVIAGERFVAAVDAACHAAVQLPVGGLPADVHLTANVRPGDAQISTARCQAAAREEVDGLLAGGAVRPVIRSAVPKGANVIRGRFVFTLKGVGTADEIPKARSVAQGNNDKAKAFVVHNLATLRQRSTRVLVSTSAVQRFRLFAHDVNQAYLQIQDLLARTLYLEPRKEDRNLFSIADDEMLLLVRPLYRVCDAGYYWHATLQKHVREDLHMTPLSSDPALYMRKGVGGLVGLLGTFVDDCFLGGNAAFQAATESTLRVFEAKPRQMDNMEFVGVRVTSTLATPRNFTLDQTQYATTLEPLPLDAPYERFTSERAAVARLEHTRPDLCCAINKAAQFNEASYQPRHVRALNATLKAARARQGLNLRYPPLDTTSLRLRAYADASFATNDDHSSQLGYIIMLADASRRVHVLGFSSRKSKRVVRSVMAGEVYALTAAFDEAYILC